MVRIMRGDCRCPAPGATHHADGEAGPDSICCADASLQWQCNQCGKVSEGFAFPYRSCPLCGGKLAPREQGPGPRHDGAALEAVRMAFEIELGGRSFYQRAAVESTDGDARALFARLAGAEGEHMELLSRRYHVEPPALPQFREELAALFAEVEHRPQDPENLFRIAIGLEKRAAGFFAARAAQAPAGSAEQRLYLELGAEEREHFALLTAEHQRWRTDKAGLFGGQPFGQHRDAGAAARHAVQCGVVAAVHERSRSHRPGVRRPAAHLRRVAHARGAGGGGLGRHADFGRATASPSSCPTASTGWWPSSGPSGRRRGGSGEPADSGTRMELHPRRGRLQRYPGRDPPTTRRRPGATVVLVDEGRRAVAVVTPVPPREVGGEEPVFWVHSSGTSASPRRRASFARLRARDRACPARAGGHRPGDRLFATSRGSSRSADQRLSAGLKIGATHP